MGADFRDNILETQSPSDEEPENITFFPTPLNTSTEAAAAAAATTAATPAPVPTTSGADVGAAAAEPLAVGTPGPSRYQSGREESDRLKKTEDAAAAAAAMAELAEAEAVVVIFSDVSVGPLPLSSRRSSSSFQVKAAPYQALKKRWVVLGVYCLYALTQVCVWNTFGPISESCRQVWGWGSDTISLLSNLGPIAYVLSGVFFSWLLNTRGLRVACLLSAFLVALGTMIRCVTMNNPAATGLVITGQFLNGLGGPLSTSGAPKLSACWFPMKERTTATTIGTMAIYLGLAISFLIGPSMVPVMKEGIDANASVTAVDLWNLNTTNASGAQYIKIQAERKDEKAVRVVRQAIQKLLYIEAVWAVGVCVLMLLYFPSHPPVPVSASSVVHRENFLQGTMDLFFSHREVLVMGLVSALSMGLLSCWSSLLNVNLSDKGVTERLAGQIGFVATVSAMAFSLSLSRLMDRYFPYLKYMVMALFSCGAVAFLLFSLCAVRVLSPSLPLLFSTVLVGKMCVEACSPALFELACELAFPVGEGMTTMLLTYSNNVLSLLFLSLFSLPGIGTAWMNWVIMASLLLTLPLLALVPRRFGRRQVDQQPRHWKSEATLSDSLD